MQTITLCSWCEQPATTRAEYPHYTYSGVFVNWFTEYGCEYHAGIHFQYDSGSNRKLYDIAPIPD